MPVGEASPEELGHRFIDAFNRRDANGLVALCHPEIEFNPTILVGERRTYRGHDGLRHWVAQLEESGSEHRARSPEQP